MPTALGRVRQLWEGVKPLGEILDRLEGFSSLEDAERELQGRIDRLQKEETDASGRVEKFVEEESRRLIEEKTHQADVEARRTVDAAKSEADSIEKQARNAADTTLKKAEAEALQIRNEAKADASREAAKAVASRQELTQLEVTISARSAHLDAINAKIDEAKRLLAG